MLTDELPDSLSCCVEDAGKDLVKAMEIAEIFISKVIKLTGSSYKTKDYKIGIENGNAFFTKYP